MKRCDDLPAFFAGELPAAGRVQVEQHLGVCEPCQRELRQLILEAAIVDAPPRPLFARGTRRLRRATGPIVRRPAMWAGLAVLAAAAGFLLYARTPAITTPAPLAQLALAGERSFVGRLADPGLDRHRPYNVARSGPAGEDVSLTTLAALERSGDLGGLFGAYLLAGNPKDAGKVLARRPAGPATDSDRAALALAESRADLALGHAGAALAARPDFLPALWNQGLALADLHLPLAAADRFERIAARGEPGWAREAQERAARLRASQAERTRTWDEASRAAEAMVANREPMPLAAATLPDLGRDKLAETLRQVADLAPFSPLAEALGVPAWTRVQPAGRAEATRLYRAALAAPETDWPALARRTRDVPDVALGAVAHGLTTRGQGAAELLAWPLPPREEPWLRAWMGEKRAWHHVYLSRNYPAAMAELDRALADCPAGLPERRARLEALAALVSGLLGRAEVASQHLSRAFADAARSPDLSVDLFVLYIAGEAAQSQDSGSVDPLALSAAFFEERARQRPSCKAELYGLDFLTVAATRANRQGLARGYSDQAEELTAGRCREVAPRINSVHARALLIARDPAASAADRQGVRAAVARLRKDAPTGQEAYLDESEGLVLLASSPDEGRALLRRAAGHLARLPDDAGALEVHGSSLTWLAVDAAARGQAGQALALLAEVRGLPAPTRCALGVAGGRRLLVAAIGPDGQARAVLREVPDGQRTLAEAVPAELAAPLAGCPVVDVFAGVGYHGRAGLLPAQVAWRYRTAAHTPARPAQHARLVITEVTPPAGLGLPPLLDSADTAGARVLRGGQATPDQALAAMADASEIEIHAHGVIDPAHPGAASLVLSPAADGAYLLTAEDVRAARLRGAPLVLLAACHAGRVTSDLEPWGLAEAFRLAGARTVIAATDALPDAGLGAGFAALAADVRAGRSPAAALRDARLQHPDRAWLGRLIVFE